MLPLQKLVFSRFGKVANERSKYEYTKETQYQLLKREAYWCKWRMQMFTF